MVAEIVRETEEIRVVGKMKDALILQEWPEGFEANTLVKVHRGMSVIGVGSLMMSRSTGKPVIWAPGLNRPELVGETLKISLHSSLL